MANSAELFSRANEEFVEENYEEAIKFYTDAVAADDRKDEYYVNRSHAFIKLEKYTEALNDAEKAIQLNPNSAKAYLRNGIACFNLDKFQEAKVAFIQGQNLQASDKNFAMWIRKCEAEINLSSTQPLAGGDQMTVGASNVVSPPTPSKDATTTASAAAGSSSEVSPTPLPMPSGAKTRYDWYQTESHVIITILLKNITQENLSVDIQRQNVSVTVKLATGGDYSLELDLAHPICEDQSRVKLMASKIELMLKKQEGIRWGNLESDGTVSSTPAPLMNTAAPEAAAAPSSADSHPPKYPSSSHHGQDWDKLVAEIKEEEKEEKPEGEAALNKLFQQIYSDGSDEVRKAMNKSFVESGGTVLSTNWGEIGTEKVTCKPPDGMEWKKWDGAEVPPDT